MQQRNKSRVIKMKRFLLGGVREIHSFNRMALVDLLGTGHLNRHLKEVMG